MVKKKDKANKLLTDVELELMNILWRLEEGSVNDVLADLSPERKLAYTSVSTVLRILEQKEVVESRKEGRGHVYSPRLSKEVYEAASLRHIVRNVFDGAPASLVRRLLDDADLTAQELESIRALLDKRKPQ